MDLTQYLFSFPPSLFLLLLPSLLPSLRPSLPPSLSPPQPSRQILLDERAPPAPAGGLAFLGVQANPPCKGMYSVITSYFDAITRTQGLDHASQE